MMTAEQFQQSFLKTKNPRGVLGPFKEDLFKLRQQGATYKDLQHFLSLNDVSVSVTAIQQYFQRHASKNSNPENTNETENANVNKTKRRTNLNKNKNKYRNMLLPPVTPKIKIKE